MSLLSGLNPADVHTSARRLAAGELVAFATETVYGLGANALDDAAVAAIYAAKGRPAGHPLIVHVASLEAALRFSPGLGTSARRLIAAFWPGPLTVIGPRAAGMAAAAAGGQDSIGLRMPAHPVALALLQQAAVLGVAGVAAPSANRYGRVSPTTAAHVQQEFGDALTVLDGGACEVGIESTIVDCTSEPAVLLRPGQLGRAALEHVLGHALGQQGPNSPRAPGSLKSHYAPRTPVHLLTTAALSAELTRLAAVKGLNQGRGAAGETGGQGASTGNRKGVAVYSRQAVPAQAMLMAWRQMPDAAADTARELFSVLRDLDAVGADSILIEQPPSGADWDGVRDRVQRAAAA